MSIGFPHTVSARTRTFVTSPSRIPEPAPFVRLLSRASLIAFLVVYGLDLKSQPLLAAQKVTNAVRTKTPIVVKVGRTNEEIDFIRGM